MEHKRIIIWVFVLGVLLIGAGKEIYSDISKKNRNPLSMGSLPGMMFPMSSSEDSPQIMITGSTKEKWRRYVLSLPEVTSITMNESECVAKGKDRKGNHIYITALQGETFYAITATAKEAQWEEMSEEIIKFVHGFYISNEIYNNKPTEVVRYLCQ